MPASLESPIESPRSSARAARRRHPVETAARALIPVAAPLLFLAARGLGLANPAWIPVLLAALLLPLCLLRRGAADGVAVAVAVACAGAAFTLHGTGAGVAAFAGWLVPSALASPAVRWLLRHPDQPELTTLPSVRGARPARARRARAPEPAFDERPDAPAPEPLRTTLLRTASIALAVGGALTLAFGSGLARWPVNAALALWPAFGGHWVEVAYLRGVRPRVGGRGAQVVARIAVWLAGGVLLALGAALTARFAFALPPVRWPLLLLGGPGFVGVELVAHLALRVTGRPSLWDGRG